MRRSLAAFCRSLGPLSFAGVILFAGRAFAEPPPDAPFADFPRLVLDSGRPPVSPPDPDVLRLQVHGEYQVRYEHLRSLPLDVTPSMANAKPGAIEDSLGQNDFVYHWLRITPRLQFRDKLQLVGQLDVVTGVVLGELAHETSADYAPRDGYNGLSEVQPRWLFLEWETGYGTVRAGQQPNHWGMGIVANDGDHVSLFGDYRYGDISERIEFETKPGGAASPVTVAIAGDLVYRDAYARLTRGEDAYQGVLRVSYAKGAKEIGLYGVYRHQTTDQTSEPGSAPTPKCSTRECSTSRASSLRTSKAPTPSSSGQARSRLSSDQPTSFGRTLKPSPARARPYRPTAER